MNFKRTNNIVGWVICIIACIVYIMTMEATGSLWDCGEFISSVYKVQVPHPPGAPLFVLLGRLFTMFLSPSQAALGVNLMSALSSGFTILFLFWTITHFARRIMVSAGEVISREKMIAIMGAGVVGALAYTFSDSFWFSAVEGEVYAMSSLFTALVFWAILKWEHEADEPYADRWIVFIAFMMGLSIGVHLLNLLTIPAMVMVYYFKRYKVTPWGTFWAFVIGCGLTGLVQKFVIQDTIKASGYMDVFFVNSLHMPFFSGFAFYFIALVAVLIYGYRKPKLGLYAPLILIASVIVIPAFNNDGGGMIFFKLIIAAAVLFIPYFMKLANIKPTSSSADHYIRLTISCILFLLLGYSTYITTMVRSTANPSVDMYNVDNPISLVGYLGREQYGDFPLVYGQVFTARPTEYKETGNVYARGKDKYEVAGKKVEPVYAPEDKMLFPRVWDASNDQGHADYYRIYLGLQQGEKPSFADNIKFFLGYQVNFMYFRYFMWNFVGKQNDTQGYGNVRDGNWVSGIPIVDNVLYGDQSTMPDSLKENKAHNRLFFLPLILGILGLLYHYKKHRRDSLIVGLLFFFTGFAIVIYLNQAGNQPRERDYAYVGSFYAFAVWIGLGVLSLYDILKKQMKGSVIAAPLSAVICILAVPVLMGFQEWDDHDRSTKTVARDVAKDYLESCAPNAILFTVGDNDTYPLWYAQEVENIRPDVRVINLSLLGVDWYIDQQRQKVNNSDPVPMTWSADKYRGENRNYIRFYDAGVFPQDKFYNLKEVMGFMASDDPRAKLSTTDGSQENFLPTQKLFIPVNVAQVIKSGVVDVTDTAKVMSQLPFQISKSYLLKNDLAVYDIIAANDWKRPIYFTSPTDLGINDYLQMDGLTYRLVPIHKEPNNDMLGADFNVNKEVMYKNLMTKFAFGGAEKNGTYFDEPNRKLLQYLRNAYTRLGTTLAQDGEKDTALIVLNKADKGLLEANFPYAMTSPNNMHNYSSLQTAYAYYLAGDIKKADEIAGKITRDCQQQLQYYRGLPPSRLSNDLQHDGQLAEQFISLLQRMKNDFSGDSTKQRELPANMNTGPDSPKGPADSGK
ncbi:DUF2723 domain-containing protein [Chitinophaga agrisoli]|uniref:DUF2723 domain-containing protein n=1 Tax=Chitinophaga agrisoli TaxID=2607653 RepID=A0A5B2VJV5_9BACT|nr:DUF2723 domain-containing protein [Chitinophaga agrisoli]KAA2239124.1 DUF2723 domain-containing protein [Chitinophaga agrisoli]